MPHPKSPHAYEDIRLAFDLALAHNGARKVCADANEAIKWRHRAHRFRSTLRTAVDGLIPPTPYDTLTLRLAGNVVLIELAGLSGMETLDGQPLDSTMIVREDDMVEEARALAKELGVE